MKAERVQEFLAALGRESHVGDEWVRASCPLAPWTHDTGRDSHPSFGVTIDDGGASRAFCYTCDFRGDLLDLILELRMHTQGSPIDLSMAISIAENEGAESDLSVALGQQTYTGKEFIAFPPTWLESFKALPLVVGNPGTAYCLKRGLGEKMILDLDLRWDSSRDRVCFPIRTFTGELAGMQGRHIKSDHPIRYLSYPYNGHSNGMVWLGEQSIDLDRTVVLTEGPFDYASIKRVYSNVLAGLTATVSQQKFARIQDVSRVVTFYDNGTGGDKGRERALRFFASLNTQVIHIIPGDDAGAATEAEIKHSLSSVMLL